MIISSDKFFELCSISLYILDFLLTDICPWVWTGTWGLVAYRESEQWFVLSRWCLSDIRDTLQKLTCIWKYIWRCKNGTIPVQGKTTCKYYVLLPITCISAHLRRATCIPVVSWIRITGTTCFSLSFPSFWLPYYGFISLQYLTCSFLSSFCVVFRFYQIFLYFFFREE